MATERLPAEGRQAPAWPPAYEQSAWLDVHNQAIQVEGEPETEEEFAAAYDFLHVATVYFETDFESLAAPTKGLWWTVTADDVKAELEHRNQWATWEALHRREPDATVVEVQLAHVLALSYRRLQALEEIGGAEQPAYPLFLHLHEKLREARLAEAELDQVLPRSQEPAPPVSAFLRTPAWQLVYAWHSSYNPDSHTHRIIYGNPAAARYGFEVIDFYQPAWPKTDDDRELHFFPNQAQAVAVYYEYQAVGYMMGDVDDYWEDVTIAEPWEPGE
jgi:hypothetical protein